ncbi:MAG: family 43 glycosylhydrolase [Treponema sp.]|nr:family 43 glycosylhydrolase [Treponema sp.]
MENGKVSVFREAADVSIRLFDDRYYLFASMTKGFYYSSDLVDWEYKETPELPAYDYAPDVGVIDNYLYVCASSRSKCSFYRTTDPLKRPFEEIPTDMIFWDPNLFQDEDGRVYLYWGCSDREPIWGIELDKHTLKPKGEKTVLIEGNPDSNGWERCAENNDLRLQVKNPYFTGGPFMEGAWMTKHKGTYYLQYASPGTEYNVYSDGVYVSDKPLGPFTCANHNPVSAKPGGFITGAGHGSTFCDKYGNWWHASTMRISVNHPFERRLGLFPAEFDAHGLFCVNQHFADYPMLIPENKIDIWNGVFVGWMLLSYKKHAQASSSAPGFIPENAVNEDIRSYWMAADSKPGHSLSVDLGKLYTVNAVQLNLGDHKIPPLEFPPDRWRGEFSKRIIDADCGAAEYLIEVSQDNEAWQTLKDTRGSSEDHTHEYVVLEDPLKVRYIRATGYKMPYESPFTISGIRVFGKGDGTPPPKVSARANWSGPVNASIRWQPSEGADGYNVRFGISREKLYSSWLLYDRTELDLGMLAKGRRYFVCVDAFNENGVTGGEVTEVRS